jgi:hypothetical protein
VVVLVLMVLFVSPTLQLEPDAVTPQRVLLRSLRAMDHFTRQAFIESDYLYRTGSFNKVLFLCVKGVVYVDEPVEGLGEAFRSQEVFSLAISPDDLLEKHMSSGNLFRGCGAEGVTEDCTVVKFDVRGDFREEGKLGCYLIIFMIFLLTFGSWMFTGE